MHETGFPWNNPSEDHLREWLDLDREAFYDDRRIAIVPMGVCYPGREERGGARDRLACLGRPLSLARQA